MTEKEDRVIEAVEGKLLFSKEEIDLCLVTKVLTSKRVNCEAFKNVMKSVWKVHHNTRFEPAGENVFCVQFK